MSALSLSVIFRQKWVRDLNINNTFCFKFCFKFSSAPELLQPLLIVRDDCILPKEQEDICSIHFYYIPPNLKHTLCLPVLGKNNNSWVSQKSTPKPCSKYALTPTYQYKFDNNLWTIMNKKKRCSFYSDYIPPCFKDSLFLLFLCRNGCIHNESKFNTKSCLK